MPTIEAMLAEAPGFGKCSSCRYLQGGPAELCHQCARQTVEPLAAVRDRCGVCDQPFPEGDRECRNPVCAMTDRWFEWNFSIAMMSGPLRRAILAYKYDGRRGWGAIFGRILVGFLDAHVHEFREMDLIVASPTFIAPDAQRQWDHVRDILRAASREDAPFAPWPFDVDGEAAIVKTADTERMVKVGGYQARKQHAETVLRGALHVPNPDRIKGKKVLVFDDVFTVGGHFARSPGRSAARAARRRSMA